MQYRTVALARGWMMIALALGALAGCASSSDDVCQMSCSCQAECDREAQDSCLREHDAKSTQADSAGCSDEWAAVETCSEQQGTCHEGTFDTSSCLEAQAELNRCLGE